jgi:hypothetical protein
VQARTIAGLTRNRTWAYDAPRFPQLICAGEIVGTLAPANATGGADGATVRNLSGTRDRAGMGTLESVEDGFDPPARADGGTLRA